MSSDSDLSTQADHTYDLLEALAEDMVIDSDVLSFTGGVANWKALQSSGNEYEFVEGGENGPVPCNYID